MQAITITWRTSRSRFTKNLLKSAYKDYHKELNRDTTIYSCNLEDKDRQLVTQANQRASTQESKSKDERGDLFAEVQNHHT
jgi:hypothetical protein